MRYTIITPTVLRASLKRLCDSIDAQTCDGWEHLVMVDTLERDDELLSSIVHPQRRVIFCAQPHRDWGDTCRRNAWPLATGDRLLYVDDDNYLADDRVLETLRDVSEPVVLFPLQYRGEVSAPLPIEVGRSDGNGLMVDRRIGQWPLVGAHESERDIDGEFVVTLTTGNPYEALFGRALVVYDSPNRLS